MGDSITEGTIVEWAVEVGQAVKEDDVVALVETDKVTIEIKASMEGVVTQKFGNVDDTVEVGADLYEIDADAQATVVGSSADGSSSSNSPEDASGTQPEPQIAAASIDDDVAAQDQSTSSHRVPSIRFLGKDGWARLLAGASEEPAGAAEAATTAVPASTAQATQVVLDGGIIHPMYGRPRFSEDEMEALIMGGANCAPKVVELSHGAKFK